MRIKVLHASAVIASSTEAGKLSAKMNTNMSRPYLSARMCLRMKLWYLVIVFVNCFSIIRSYFLQVCPKSSCCYKCTTCLRAVNCLGRDAQVGVVQG